MGVLTSCVLNHHTKAEDIVRKWMGKEIVFPNDSYFPDNRSNQYADVKSPKKFTVFTYVDTMGCISCYLKAEQWKSLINDSIFREVKFLFAFPYSKKDTVEEILKQANFDYPVYYDRHNILDSLNHFPIDFGGQSFLIDSNNKVLLIGNPIHNRKIKNLYSQLVQGKTIGKSDEKERVLTNIVINNETYKFQDFDWKKEQTAIFIIKNIGNELMLIHDVITSCNCISVNYNKKPVRPGEEITLSINYKAGSPGFFAKTIQVYCNAEASPLKLRVEGYAIDKEQ